MEDEKLKEILRMIKKVRTSKGVSQRELARRLGMHASVYNRLENGGSYPNTATLLKIADALNVDPAELLGRFSEEFNRLWDVFCALSPERQQKILEFVGEQATLERVESEERGGDGVPFLPRVLGGAHCRAIAIRKSSSFST